jgi:hypothetical protein
MKRKCLACGIEKDTDVKEIYPYPEDGLIDKPIEPLMAIECKGSVDRRFAEVCHECFHELDVDMWISDRHWTALNPIIPFERLPQSQIT